MGRTAPSAPLVITLVGGLVLLCGGLVVMLEYAKVEVKKRGETKERRIAAPVHPFAERLEQLSLKERAVTQLGEDDPAHFGRYVQTQEAGAYHDIVSLEPVFSSRDKLESVLGYAEFSKPLDPAKLVEEPGVIGGEQRLNVKGKTSGARLGWIVTGADGTRRYVINSSALRFVPENDAASSAAPEATPPGGTAPGQK